MHQTATFVWLSVFLACIIPKALVQEYPTFYDKEGGFKKAAHYWHHNCVTLVSRSCDSMGSGNQFAHSYNEMELAMATIKLQDNFLKLPVNQDTLAPQTLSEFTLDRIAFIQNSIAKLSLIDMDAIQPQSDVAILKSIHRGDVNKSL